MGSNLQQYWEQKHIKYSKQNWITQPTIFATQVIKFFPPVGKILELGCGQGQDAVYFAMNGYEVTGTDFSPFAIKSAQERMPKQFSRKIEFKLLDLDKSLKFKPNSFDVVYSHLALHYFTEERTQQLFSEIYEVLKDGGIMAALVNTLDDPDTTRLTKIGDDYYISPDGLKKRFFSTELLANYTKGFKTLLLDNHGETHKDEIKTLIRFVGKKL